MWIAYAKFEGAHLVFVWDVNDACPGHFLQVFKPIPTVIFATNSSRYVLDKQAKIVYENSWAVFTWTMMQNNIPKNRVGFPSWHEIEYRMYSRFEPTREVMQKVDAFVKRFNICNASAMHLRVTDLAIHLARKKKVVNLESYFHFVESRPADEPVYLLTDNPKSQKLFLDKYGPKKIIVYSKITDEEHQQPVASSLKKGDPRGIALVSQPLATTNVTVPQLAEDHRFTTLEHTLIDVLIAAHSKVDCNDVTACVYVI